jgi:hypothetical protein
LPVTLSDKANVPDEKEPCHRCEHPAELHELLPIDGAPGTPTIYRYLECNVIGCECKGFVVSPYAN